MKRSSFLKTLAAGAAAIGLTPYIVSEPIVPAKVRGIVALRGHGPGWFKIDASLWDSTEGDIIHVLDQMCINMFGTPIKEIGYEGTDFADGYLTVQAFSKEHYNSKMQYDTMD